MTATIFQKVDREVKGAALSQSRNIFYLLGSKDTYYVPSERSEDIYYLVKYNYDVVEWCSCPDSSIKLMKCKHIWSIEKSIVKGTLKEIDKLPTQVKTFQNNIPLVKQSTASWKDSEYSY